MRKKRKSIPLVKVNKDVQAALVEGLNKSPLSRLLRIAVRDAKAAKARGRELDMEIWARSNGCACCLAGAVICETTGPTRRLGGHVIQVPPFAGAINALRVGAPQLAANELSKGQLPVQLVIDVERRIKDSWNDELMRAPFRTYLQAARMLEAAGY